MTAQDYSFYKHVFESIEDYAIFTTDADGVVTTANRGVELLLGYRREDFLGQSARIIFTEEDIEAGMVELEMAVAQKNGRAADDRWHVRADGSRIWVNGIMSDLRNDDDDLLGFVKVLRDRTEERLVQEKLQESEANYRATARELAEARDELESQVRERTADLLALNEELESFNYSVSHDLRAPLRGLTGFSQILLQEYGDSLDDVGRQYLQRVSSAAERMGDLIDALLALSRVSRLSLRIEDVDLSRLALDTLAGLEEQEPEREVVTAVEPGVIARGDERLLRVVIENLIANAWKFTGDSRVPRIEFGANDEDGRMTYFVRDNGAGFDMAYLGKLFMPFQRLHSPRRFSGLGIGLATVERIIHRHGGTVWGEGKPGAGATFYFTLAANSL